MPNETSVSEVRTSQSEPEREQRIFSFKATQLVWLLFGILIGLIALRIGLKLIGANPESTIVAAIYGFTSLFLFPFANLISSPTVGNMQLELSSMFAILVFGLIAWVIAKVVWLIFYRPAGGPVVGVTETTASESHSTP